MVQKNDISVEKNRDTFRKKCIVILHLSTSLLGAVIPHFLGIAALGFLSHPAKVRLLAFLAVVGLTVALSGCQPPGLGGPKEMAPTPRELRRGGPAEYLNAQLRSLIPSVPKAGDKQIFAHYAAKNRSVWASNWTRALDFSGVAWDSSKAGTLVHPQFVVFASHFQRRLGEELTFHDRLGQPVRRKIAAKVVVHTVRSPDVTVARLNLPVTERVAHYPILPAGFDYGVLSGAALLVTDKQRSVHLFRINRVSQEGFEELGARPALGEEFGAAWQERLEKGDSGHPAFVVIKGKLVLVSTLKGGGWSSTGPFYGGQRLQSAIVAAMEELGEQPNQGYPLTKAELWGVYCENGFPFPGEGSASSPLPWYRCSHGPLATGGGAHGAEQG